MRTSASRDFFASARTVLCRLSAVAALMSLSACMNDEFRTGTDLVNGEDMVIGETSFPVKAWTVPDPVRDTLSARVEADIVYQIGDPVNNNKKGYNFCMLGNYSYPGVCSVEAGFAVQLQVGSTLPNFGDIVVDSVKMFISYTPIQDFSGDSATDAFTGFSTEENIYKGLYPSGYTFFGTPLKNNKVQFEIYRLAEDIPLPVTEDGVVMTAKNYIPLAKKWQTAELLQSENFEITLDTLFSTTEITDTSYTYDEEGNILDTTYKYADSIYPRMELKLNRDYWQSLFDEFKGQIITYESFVKRFKGLYFKSAEGVRMPFMMLNMGQKIGLTGRTCAVTLYYHTATSTGMTMDLVFYQSDYSGAIAANSIQVTLDPRIEAMIQNPDTLNGEKDLYILPFGQTEVVVDLIDQQTIETIRQNGWTINDAYIDFTTKNDDSYSGITPAAELWMYVYPHADQFVFWDPETGIPTKKVDFYLPDEATFSQEEGEWYYSPRSIYGLNGVINENSTASEFANPGKYRMRVTRTLIDAVYGENGGPVRVGLRLPMGAAQKAPNLSVLNGENLRLIVKYTKKKDLDGPQPL